jgi:hypothetical protein
LQLDPSVLSFTCSRPKAVDVVIDAILESACWIILIRHSSTCLIRAMTNPC